MAQGKHTDRTDADVLGDLIARKKLRPAIELLREQILTGAAPSVEGRLQLVDLLTKAGRGHEAAPILIGLADEYASGGYVAKAIAILKRVEKLEPGSADIADRLAALAHEQVRLAPSASVSGRFPPIIDESTPEEKTGGVADRFRDAMRRFVSRWSGSVTPEDAAEETRAAPEDTAGAPASTDSLSQPAAMPSSEITPPQSVPPPAPSLPATSPDGEHDMTIEDLLQRLSPDQTLPPIPLAAFASLPSRETDGDASEARDSALEALIRRISPHDTLPPTPLSALGLDPDDTAAFVCEAASQTLDLDLSEPGESEPLSDEAFEQQILSLVEDVLRQAPAEAAAPPAPFQGTLMASHLLAAPLFGSLSAEELLAVVRGLELKTFEPGEALVTEGERSFSLFILVRGRAKVFVRSRDGHAMEVGEFEEGDFFGEVAALSGSRRSATVTAGAACEVLELDKKTLDGIALAQPKVREALEEAFIAHLDNPEAMAVRSVELGRARFNRDACDVLESHFGAAEWRPHMRLRLAALLLRAGKHDSAVPILVSLAQELARNGYHERAVALVKKIERIQSRHVKEMPLAPLRRAASAAPAIVAGQDGKAGSPALESRAPFEQWLVRLAREAIERRAEPGSPPARAAAPRGYSPGLRANPLFADVGEDELRALIASLQLVGCEAGDIIVCEGEPGRSVFVLVTGSVRVLVRNPEGRSVPLCRLGEGSFFGEISTLSGRPRSATVVAVTPCELLEIEKIKLDEIAVQHPRVREALERVYVERATDPHAERIRVADL